MGLPVPWEAAQPELSSALRRLSPNELSEAEADPVNFLRRKAVASHITDELTQLTVMPALNSGPVTAGVRPSGVDDRKWRQIAYFNAVLSTRRIPHVEQWVDWCAGKGHLGTALHERVHQPVTCVELNESLVVRGNERMRRTGQAVAFVRSDVLSDNLSATLTAETGVAALHACGHLNSRLFELARQFRPTFMAVVPCCYQRIDGMRFSPLSAAGKKTGLEFTRHQLRLPALDEVKTSPGRREFRRREMAFRLGVDLLFREASGNIVYTPLGKIPPNVVRGSFQSFAKFAANKMVQSLPLQVRWQAAEKAGWRQYQLVSALSISRQLFRRAIEVWLFLDRVAFLEESGYSVQYGEFCPREITPRNLMLLATFNP